MNVVDRVQQTDDREAHVKINIFALPNQTTILVTMLVVAVFGGLLSVTAISQPGFFVPITLGLFVLSLRGLLSWPDRESARYKLVPAGNRFGDLQSCVTRLARQLELRRVPTVMISTTAHELAIVGSWRRWYIVMDEQRAQMVTDELQKPERVEEIEAGLLHELYHFKHGDHLSVGYAHALLRAAGGFGLWNAVLLMGLIWLLILAQKAFFQYSPNVISQRFDAVLPGLGQTLVPTFFGSMAQWEQLREKATRLDLGQVQFALFGNIFPFVFISVLLLGFFWQRLMRAREIYADAGVAQQQGRVQPVIRAPIYFAAFTSKAADTTAQDLPIIQDSTKGFRRRRIRLGQIAEFHDPPNKRLENLCFPERAFGGWLSTALLAGLFIVALDMLLYSTSALFYVGQWPLHFPVLTASILVSLALIVKVMLGQPLWGEILKIITVIVLIHTALLLLSLSLLWVLLLTDPAGLSTVIEIFARFLSGYSVLSPQLLTQDPIDFVLRASAFNLAQVPVQFALIVLGVWANTLLIRSALTWYGFPNAERRLKYVMYGAITLVTLALALVIIPLATDLVLLRFADLLSPIRWLITAVVLVGVAAGCFWFVRQHRRYAQRCPRCSAISSGTYKLGKQCPECGRILHVWLLADYDTES
jgi:hypothetical protein